MAAPEAVGQLVERYRSNRESYHGPTYNETQVRIEFIDPLFELLGWDISNRAGYAESYKEVVHEARLKVAGRSKAPDYAFRIGGQRKFFLEAKKPRVHVGSDATSAMQLRRYAWTAKFPFSVLTNFEELSIYDTRVRPRRNDSALVARWRHFRIDDYVGRWDELHEICGKDGIQRGASDRAIRDLESKRDVVAVDDAFLSEIERWRVELAAHIARKNLLSAFELQTAVQLIIDRIIFLRIAEDRGIEPEQQLRKTVTGSGRAYRNLVRLFSEADKRYNSGLFHLPGSTTRGSPDSVTSTLDISDLVIRGLVANLYYPSSPYEFSAMPADILGQVYERFLGKVIRLTAGTAVVEEKPEVKKAGGVYYTPTHIVSYIIQRTLGAALEGVGLEKIGGRFSMDRQLRVIDPACGSGSFLIEAYQFLLDWHLARYSSDCGVFSKGTSATIAPSPSGEWRLTLAERKRILVAHIYGVDIDLQAVEVAKLSLLLKLLESQDEAALEADSKTRNRILPDLDQNIRDGNSLIDSRYFDLFPDERADSERHSQINPFNWSDEFPSIMAGGGFDVVVGNPPYFSIDKTWGVGDHRLAAIKAIFPTIHTDKTDVYYYFIQRALEISGGFVGFIVSRAFLEAAKASKLRGALANSGTAVEVFDFGNHRVFPKVGIATAMIFLKQSPQTDCVAVSKVVQTIESHQATSQYLSQSPDIVRFDVPRGTLSAEPWHLAAPGNADLYSKIDGAGEALSRFMVAGQGMQTGANTVFGGKTAAELKALAIGRSLYRRRASNTDIQAYGLREKDDYFLYLEDAPSFARLPKPLQKYLSANRKKLEGRAAFKRGDCSWWQYTWPLHKERYDRPRILCPYLSHDNRFVVAERFTNIGLTDTTIIFDGNQEESLKYICCILNSAVMTYRFRGIGKLKGGGIYEYFDNSIGELPVRRIDFGNAAEVKLHDSLVEDYDAIAVLVAKSGLGSAERRHLTALTKRVDRVVAELYGLEPGDVAQIDLALADEAMPSD